MGFEIQTLPDRKIPKLEKTIQEFSECLEACRDVSDITRVLIDIDLFQKEHQDILGIPGVDHTEQPEKVLSSDLYWKISNLKRALAIRREILEKGLQKFTSFSVGGSIGAGYLGYMLAKDEQGKLPEVIFGASAGSLFPILYLLWKEAVKVDSKNTKPGIKGLISYLPQSLGNKTMWSNGDDLIQEFQKSANSLIDIINQAKPEQKLPKIDQITIGEISKTFGIIASRKKSEGGYQEVVFSGKDNLMNAVIASSNPEIQILGINFSVLTSSQNKFLGNVWHDGDHTNYNPLNYGEMLGLDKKTQVIALPFLYKGSDKFRQIISSGSYKVMNHDERISLLEKTSFETFSIPSSAGKLLISDSARSDYKISDQNSGWSIETMSYRAKISYAQGLILGVSENQEYYKNIGVVLDKLGTLQLNNEDQDIILQQFIIHLGNLGGLSTQKEREEFDKSRDNVIDGYSLATKIQESTSISIQLKESLLRVIFYHKESFLINKHLSSATLPLFLLDHSVDQEMFEHLSSKYTPAKLEEILKTGKLPPDYFIEILRRVDLGMSFIEYYGKIKALASDAFYKMDYTELIDTLDTLSLIQIIVIEPRFHYYAKDIAEHILKTPPLPYYFGKDLGVALTGLMRLIDDNAIKKGLKELYETLRMQNMNILSDKIRELKELPTL